MKLGLVLSGVIGLALSYLCVMLLVCIAPSIEPSVHQHNLVMLCIFMALCSATGAFGFFALIVDKVKGK